jgi:hypothetical protein
LKVTYTFNGKVLPERTIVSIPTLKLEAYHQDAGIRFESIISISLSQISVLVEVKEKPELLDLYTLKNVIEDTVRSVVDAFGYLTGRGYDVEITSSTDQNGMQAVFGVGIPELEEEGKHNERPLTLEKIMDNLGKSVFLAPALADLREAIRSAHTGFFCYRAIESLRQHFRQPNDNDDKKPSWERLRTSLRIDKTWIDGVKKYADSQRHGENTFVSGQERVRIMQRTWKIVDRFLIYLESGSNTLPEDRFPILKV